jgi:hypothetical protein
LVGVSHTTRDDDLFHLIRVLPSIDAAHGGGTFSSFGDEFSPCYDCNLKLKNWSKMLECFYRKIAKKKKKKTGIF